MNYLNLISPIFWFILWATSHSAYSSSEDELRRLIWQDLNAITQDVLAEQEPKMWHSYQFGSGIGNREDLVINGIHSNDEFDIGEDVLEWKSINLHKKSYSVGLMASGFTVFSAELNRDKTAFITSTKIMTFQSAPTIFTLFKIWNVEEQKYDIIVITGENIDIHWYRINDDNILEHTWWWRLSKKVTHLQVLEVGDTTKLLVVNDNDGDSDGATADIYEFVLDGNVPDFWLFQTLHLDCPAKSTAINKFGPNIYLSIPQNVSNSILIFQFQNHEFTTYQNITSENVAFVTDFKIGFNSFLAVGGNDYAIYRFTKSGLVKEQLIGMNLAEVTYFLPIPVNSYREEIILLVQHNIDYSTHVVPIVEVLVYARGSFQAHYEIPCTVLGLEKNGAKCMVDIEREAGISGSAVLSLDKILGVVVPRFEVHSGLFMIDWKLQDISNPLTEKIEKVVKTAIEIEKMLQKQRSSISDIENKLKNALKLNEDNVITGAWTIDTLSAPDATFENPHKVYINPDAYAESSMPLGVDQEFKIHSDKINSIKLNVQSSQYTNRPVHVFDNLEIDGQLEIRGVSHIDHMNVVNLNDENFDATVENCAKRSQKNEITGQKTFLEAHVERLSFSTINNVSADEIIFKTGKDIHIQGDLTFENPLTVTGDVKLFPGGKVNDIDFSEDLVYMNSDQVYERARFENIEVVNMNNLTHISDEDVSKYFIDNVYDENGKLNIELDSLNISHINVSTEHINGQNYLEFANSLYLTTEDYYFPGNTTIKGKLRVLGNADIETLNGLKYPEEYLMSKETGFTKITGKKVFKANVSVNEIIVNGLVDGVDPNKIITCSLNQTIPGNFTFSDLEVTEKLVVEGSILLGPNRTKFIPNPTLEDVFELNTDVLFENLEVDGVITVSGNFENRTLEEYFQEFVYKDEESVTITAKKEFTNPITIHNNLEIRSNKIGSIDINTLLTKDTEQILPITELTKAVSIKNLDIVGLYNDLNFTQIFDEFIMLDEDEDVDYELTFESSDDEPDILASELHIGTLNGMTSSDLFFRTGDRVLEEAEFDVVRADEVVILEDFDYEIECFDIKEFDENRLSLTREQDIGGRFDVEYGNVENIQVDVINGYDWEDIKKIINISDVFNDRLINGEMEIEELHVNGSVQAEQINEYNLEWLYNNVIWTDRSNNISSNIIFNGPVYAKNVEVKNLNNANFNDFISDIVFKNETDVTFTGFKTFEEGFTVTGDMDTDKINDLNVEDILLKSEDQDVHGHLIIHGDVWIEDDLNVVDSINDVSINLLKEQFKITDDGSIYVKGDLTLGDVMIDRLEIEGTMNGYIPNVYIENLVSIYDDVVINGTTTFKNKVHIRKNLGVATTINGVDLDEFAKNVVLKSSDDYITGLVTFTQDVVVTDSIYIESNLDTRYLSGCDLQFWKENAAVIENDYLPGKVKFEKVTAENVTLNFWNGVDMSTIIPLHTDQVINATMNFNFITTDNDIEVGGLVNGMNFLEEYENTVMQDAKYQEISTPTVFHNQITITNNLKTGGLVNGKDLRRLVTTNTDQNLTGSYVFGGKVTVHGDLHVTGRVNGIDLADWQRRLITAHGDGVQNITDPWWVQGNVTFCEDVEGEGLLAGINVKEVAEEVRRKQEEKDEVQREIKNEYKNICTKVQDIFEARKPQVFLFKHLEFHQEFHTEFSIGTVHHFEYENHNFLIVSQRENCYSVLYKWISNSFSKVAEMRTGEVVQFITVLDSNKVYLVTKNINRAECTELEVNLWIFSNDNLQHIWGSKHALLLQKSKLPGTFYALGNESVIEYKLFFEDKETSVHPYSRWSISGENYAFNPHGHRSELSLRNEENIVKLSRKEPGTSARNYEGPPIIGNVKIVRNRVLPLAQVGEIVEMEVGTPENLLHLTAVTVLEGATVQDKTDEIRIYENISPGKLFHKIHTNRPSSLNVLDFGLTGETILAFLENFEILQVYEYKGIAGFQHRSSAKIAATKMISISLPLSPFESKRKFLLLVNENSLTILQAVMNGDRSNVNLDCNV